jgi:hypothetical protein
MGSILRQERRAAAERMAQQRGDDRKEYKKMVWSVVYAGGIVWALLLSGYVELIFK